MTPPSIALFEWTTRRPRVPLNAVQTAARDRQDETQATSALADFMRKTGAFTVTITPPDEAPGGAETVQFVAAVALPKERGPLLAVQMREAEARGYDAALSDLLTHAAHADPRNDPGAIQAVSSMIQQVRSRANMRREDARTWRSLSDGAYQRGDDFLFADGVVRDHVYWQEPVREPGPDLMAARATTKVHVREHWAIAWRERR